jgi:polysaccharide export outer membrane protein
MIARFVSFSVAVLLVVGCGARGNAAFAQEQAPAPAEAPATNAAGSSDASSSGAAEPASAPAPAIATVVVDPRDYRIGPEDVLDIQVAGLTAEQLRSQLAQRLVKFIQTPEVSVIVREVHSVKVSVQGNVNMPGQFEVRSEATVLDMIARAQGFNTFANKGSIWVVRRSGGNDERLEFNYGDAIRGRRGANFFVMPGDVIIVN